MDLISGGSKVTVSQVETSVLYLDDKDLLEQYRANIELRNNSKIKFKTRTTKLTKVANSPYYRGVRLWDRLNESTQKATTEVKFKQLIA